MKALTLPTYHVRIYMSGPIEVAKQICRKECMKEGLCVTIEPTLYVYTGGEESGYVVSLINYPRFPSSEEAISARAEALAKQLMAKTYQHSALVMTPKTTTFFTSREL
jgi:hypothetical protein